MGTPDCLLSVVKRFLTVPSFQGGSKTDSNASPKHKKEEPEPELTPLDKMLLNAGPLSTDGSDKFFGLENVSIALAPA